MLGCFFKYFDKFQRLCNWFGMLAKSKGKHSMFLGSSMRILCFVFFNPRDLLNLLVTLLQGIQLHFMKGQILFMPYDQGLDLFEISNCHLST